MRSEIIFRASEKVANKYKLCQTASKAARVFNVESKGTQESINSAFATIATKPGADDAGGAERSAVTSVITDTREY